MLVPTIDQLLKIGRQKLESKGLSHADADILLAHALGVQKEILYTHPEQQSTKRDWEVYSQLLNKREKGFSVAVLIGYKYFHSLRFTVTPDTLVPRPESETLADEALHFLETKKSGSILDLGTGCGNLVISVALGSRKTNSKKFDFYAADISKKALSVARANARAHHVPIRFIQSNLFSNVSPVHFDLIMANLPYLTTRQLEESSIQKEPIGALWAGDDGLALYKLMLTEIAQFLKKSSMILLEIDPQQSDAISQLVADQLPGSHASFLQDLAGFNRVVKIGYKTPALLR